MDEEPTPVILNYELGEKHYCKDCKYHHWYYDEHKPYGCPSERWDVCGSFVLCGEESKDGN